MRSVGFSELQRCNPEKIKGGVVSKMSGVVSKTGSVASKMGVGRIYLHLNQHMHRPG